MGESDMPPKTLYPLKSQRFRDQTGNLQAFEVKGFVASKASEKQQKGKFVLPFNTVRKHRKRRRPRKEMRMRCKLVARWVVAVGPAAFPAAAGCDMTYLSALLQDIIPANTVLSTSMERLPFHSPSPRALVWREHHSVRPPRNRLTS